MLVKKTLDCCPECGSKEFDGFVNAKLNVTVSPNGECQKEILYQEKVCSSLYEMEPDTFGPFHCRKCTTRYESLPITIEVESSTLTREEKWKIFSDHVKAKNLDLDQLVDDIFSQEASALNNKGENSQISFIFKHFQDDLSALLAL